MKEVKRFGLPLVIVIAGAFIAQLIERYMTGMYITTILILWNVALSFGFGVALHGSANKASSAVFRKVIAIVLTILLLFMQLGYFTFPAMESLFMNLGLTKIYINMLYIFCGYMFVD